MRDPRERHREMLQQALARRIEDLPAGSGELVRAQIAATEPEEYDAAALACLAAAEAVGGAAAAAIPGAVAIALIAQMGLMFSGLENTGGSGSLSTAWGMPRSLNAGDAMFALAQASVLSAGEELTERDRMAAAALIDQGVRGVAEDLLASGQAVDVAAAGQKALLPSALALGALLGGGGAELQQKLAELGREWSRLPDAEVARILASDPGFWLAT